MAAESLCELFARKQGLPCLVLRTSRFFPEADDDPEVSAAYESANTQVNELLNRRVDIADVVDAHRLAIERAGAIGFGRYIISATTPFGPEHLAELRADAAGLVRRLYPQAQDLFAARGWRLFPSLDRVYVNAAARRDLGWAPRYDFASSLARLAAGQDHRSDLAITVGAKGYHPKAFADGLYPVE